MHRLPACRRRPATRCGHGLVRLPAAVFAARQQGCSSCRPARQTGAGGDAGHRAPLHAASRSSRLPRAMGRQVDCAMSRNESGIGSGGNPVHACDGMQCRVAGVAITRASCAARPDRSTKRCASAAATCGQMPPNDVQARMPRTSPIAWPNPEPTARRPPPTARQRLDSRQRRAPCARRCVDPAGAGVVPCVACTQNIFHHDDVSHPGRHRGCHCDPFGPQACRDGVPGRGRMRQRARDRNRSPHGSCVI
jgi:hypothetical protein